MLSMGQESRMWCRGCGRGLRADAESFVVTVDAVPGSGFASYGLLSDVGEGDDLVAQRQQVGDGAGRADENLDKLMSAVAWCFTWAEPQGTPAGTTACFDDWPAAQELLVSRRAGRGCHPGQDAAPAVARGPRDHMGRDGRGSALRDRPTRRGRGGGDRSPRIGRTPEPPSCGPCQLKQPGNLDRNRDMAWSSPPWGAFASG